MRGEENITVVWFYTTVRPRRETDQCGGDVVLLAQLMPSCAWRLFPVLFLPLVLPLILSPETHAVGMFGFICLCLG